MALKKGDRIKVKPGREHDPSMKGATGEVAEISTAALGIKFDGMTGVHRWHVEDELSQITEGDESTPTMPMRSATRPIRRMVNTADVAELRAEDGEGAVPVIRGYAAKFDEPTELWPGFREVVRRGAFSKTLKEGDPLALWNHNSDYPLGRSSAGSLKLVEDEKGLRYEISIDLATSWERDAYQAVKKGSVRGSSFAFRPVREEIKRNDKGRMELRELLEVELFEVSPVAFPAYKGTDASARAALDAIADPNFDAGRALEEIFAKGLTPSELRASCQSVIEHLDRGAWGSALGVDEGERDQMLRRLALVEAGA